MSRIAVVGAHRSIGQHLVAALYDRGHDAVGLVPDGENAEDVYRLGGEGVTVSPDTVTEEQLVAVFDGCDSVIMVFDGEPPAKWARAADTVDARRFVHVSRGTVTVSRDLPELEVSDRDVPRVVLEALGLEPE